MAVYEGQKPVLGVKTENGQAYNETRTRDVNLVKNVGGRPVQGVWGTEVSQWDPGAKPRLGVWGTKSPRS